MPASNLEQLAEEELQPLSNLAREVVNREGSKGVNVATLWRWTMRGCKGIKLESLMCGGVRMSSKPALSRFFAKLTALANGETAPIVSTKGRERAIREANEALDRAGI